MDQISIDKTAISPKVIFNHKDKIFLIEGESRPENSKIFYNPLISWIENYNKYLFWEKDQLEQNGKLNDLEFVFRFDYINSSSLKCVYDLLIKIEALKENVNSIKIVWLYDEGDEDMEDNGNEFANMLKLDFEIKLSQ